jgi:HK97 family phage prohead protease
MQHKSFGAEIVTKTEKGGRVLITTAGTDRDSDRVMPQGAQIENYQKNPVVMWGHSYANPSDVIGRTTNLEVTPDGIFADFELRPAVNDQDPQNIVLLLWEGGWIKAASIGFNPLQWKDNQFGGKDINSWELLEWSLVPIPANQAALRLAVKGIGMDEDTQDKPKKPPVCDEEPVAEKDGEAATAVAEAVTEAIGDIPVDPDADIEDVEDDPTKPTPEQEMRLAAILTDFVNAIMPYLQQ